ncbi:MAG: hypothetical protein ACRENN_01000 [Candidatus Eiseniibacteriota bacterium]
MDPRSDHDAPDFSLIRGGPWYWLQLKLRLVSPTSLKVVMRAALFTLVAWVPLAILTAVAGTFYRIGDSTPFQIDGGVSFLTDIAVHVRFLVALPLLILVEGPLDRYTGAVVRHLRDSGTVGREQWNRLDQAIRSTHRLRDSWIVATVLVVLAALGAWSRVTQVGPMVTGWIATPGAGSGQIQPAALWLGWVATPLFITILLRSLWRFILWTRFLFALARTPLSLSPSHPDGMGGLGSLQLGQQPFATVFFAIGAMFSATVANLVLHAGAQILDFKMLAVSLIAIAAVVYLAPLLTFTPQMLICKRMGLLRYERLAGDYTRGFERKWMGPGEPPTEPLLGTSDIQSLADIGGAFARVENMRAAPFSAKTGLTPVLAVGLPLLPLALMVMPLSDLLALLMKAVM